MHRGGFSQGKYKGNGSSLVICFRCAGLPRGFGQWPVRPVLAAGFPGIPPAARQSGRCGGLQLVFFPKKGPASSGACTGNHPAMRETGLPSWLSSMLESGGCAASGAVACFSGWSAIRPAAGPVFGIRTMHSM